MKAWLLPLLLGPAFGLSTARAVEDGSNSTFTTSVPTGNDITNWNIGWTQPSGQSGVTGWNYVGIVAGGGGAASGVYLGNNWVLTAGHVGAGTFTLAGTPYQVVPNSARSISNSHGTVDVCLFQISTAPNLPPLNLATQGPSVGDSVAMIGYGDGGSTSHETWGVNTVTANHLLEGVDGFVSTDFETAYGTNGNHYYLFLGDSGGGDFVYNSAAAQWQLVGINEALGDNNPPDSYFVELSKYASQIQAIDGVPVPALPAWGQVVLPILLLLVAAGYLSKRNAVS